MKTLQCDMCGKKVEVTKGIHGTEFQYHDFTTLEDWCRPPGVVDVCPQCFREVDECLKDVENQTSRVRKKMVKARLEAMMVDRGHRVGL